MLIYASIKTDGPLVVSIDFYTIVLGMIQRVI